MGSKEASPPLRARAEPALVQIDRIGSEGDGMARLPDGTPLYIPRPQPRAQVVARPPGGKATAERIEHPSSARVSPPCQHFGRCGGCVLQHWRDKEYQAWKSGLLSQALRQAGFTPPEEPSLLPGAPGERRRMDFAVQRANGRIILGLHALRSPEIVDITHCLILHPKLMALLPPLRALLRRVSAIRRQASVVINLLDAGPDMLLRTDGRLSFDDRAALASFAATNGLPRISCAEAKASPETIALLRPPATTMSGVPVRPPPGAFLQATAAGEAAIIDAVLRALPPKRTARARVAELYAGCGALTFALAKTVRVSAWEGDPAAVAALRQAANQNGLAGRVEATQRDLARQPLSAKELAGFAAIVLDPPHAGAAAQVPHIAAARAPTVIYVSCNLATLARDAKTLHAAGYALTAATAIDQFLWSARLESVCVFQRG